MNVRVHGQVADLMDQKDEIAKALDSTEDDVEKQRLRAMQQGVTSQLYGASGRAKVRAKAVVDLCVLLDRVPALLFCIFCTFISPSPSRRCSVSRGMRGQWSNDYDKQ